MIEGVHSLRQLMLGWAMKDQGKDLPANSLAVRCTQSDGLRFGQFKLHDATGSAPNPKGGMQLSNEGRQV